MDYSATQSLRVILEPWRSGDESSPDSSTSGAVAIFSKHLHARWPRVTVAQPMKRILVAMLLGLTACSEEMTVRDVNQRDATFDALVDGLAPSDVTVSADGAPSDGGGACGGRTCRMGELCRYDQCVPDLGRCMPSVGGDGGVANADVVTMGSADAGSPRAQCPSDAYCDDQGFCTPYGVPANRVRDDNCRTRAIPAPLIPATQCAWMMHNINGTPVVMDLRIGPRQEFEIKPSIVVIANDTAGSTYTAGGHVYVFDGRTCEQQFAITGANTEVVSSGTPAVGDLDLDGTAEIIVPAALGGVIAYRYDPAMRQFVQMWRVMAPNFTAGSIALADITGDSHPEVLYGGVLISHMGAMLAPLPTGVAGTAYARAPVLADVDLDGEVEMVINNAIYQFDAMAGRWVKEAYDSTVLDVGHDAVADFGDFSMMRGDMPGQPEIVHWDGTTLTIRTIRGTNVFTATAPLDQGGPPAIADLDGDGLPEVVVAGHSLVSFDMDCTATPRPGGRCDSRTTRGIGWRQAGLTDASGAINGVTVFDFDGDNRAEVVEADECFVRIFDGRSGDPRWSAPRFSCTWIEMPVVADTDGDNSAEIIVGANAVCVGAACPLAPGTPDPILPGFACIADAACPMGSSCVGGLCRCTMDAQCGEGNVCRPSADRMGNVCKSTFNRSIGLRVYGDARNRWVPSRPVWNQYAYSSTNINDNGTVPPRAMMRNNWQVPGLNDYRRNTQGLLGDQVAPNLTIAPSPGGCVGGGAGTVRLSARFCNRGTGIAGAMSSIQFDAVSPGGMRTPLCTASADRPIPAGMCVDVMCNSMMMLARDATVEAVADANDQVQECHEDDNRRVIYRPEDCIL